MWRVRNEEVDQRGRWLFVWSWVGEDASDEGVVVVVVVAAVVVVVVVVI